MALKYSPSLRHTQLAQIAIVIGANPLMRLFSGAIPASISASSGMVLCEASLPGTWMESPGQTLSGTVGKTGTWTGAGHANAGAGTVATYFRLYTSGGVAHMQGSVTEINGGGDMQLANATIVAGNPIDFSTFRITAGNA